MSNNYTACVNLTQDPEDLVLGEREIVKLRCADNTFGKNTETRYFDALVAGPDLTAARKLKKGDGLVISGQLTKTSYKSKKGKNKGKTVEADSMPFAKIMQITKSPSFFAGDDEAGDDQESADDSDQDIGTDAPPADEPDDGSDPLADVL